jgi:hypothetical protein
MLTTVLRKRRSFGRIRKRKTRPCKVRNLPACKLQNIQNVQIKEMILDLLLSHSPGLADRCAIRFPNPPTCHGAAASPVLKIRVCRSTIGTSVLLSYPNSLATATCQWPWPSAGKIPCMAAAIRSVGPAENHRGRRSADATKC